MRILSLGAGVQSSTLLLMMCKGEIEPCDHAIFADTQWEPQSVYVWLHDILIPEAEKVGIPVHIVTAGDIRENTLAERRSASLPFFTDNGDGTQGLLWRQCTGDYKITPIHKKIRTLTKDHVTQIFGISRDEAHRMKQSQKKSVTNEYPLIFDVEYNRTDCLRWLKNSGYELPHRSACIGCPYHSNTVWRMMKDHNPAEWEDACSFDEAIRDGIPGSPTTTKLYLHRSMVPLRGAYLQEDQTDLWGNECEGMCGV